jgi:predicted nuclease of predicted toxin-antitoxin system
MTVCLSITGNGVKRPPPCAVMPALAKLLLDEMYPAILAEALGDASIDAVTASELGLAGRSDPEIFTAAVAAGYILLTENVADFAHIAADHLTTGQHHPGVVIALSSRFSRRPAGRGPLVAAILAATDAPLRDRVVYLERSDRG